MQLEQDSNMKAINSKKIPDENIKKKIKSIETDDESSV